MDGYPALAIRPPDIAGPILEAQQIRAGQQQQQIRGQELQSGAISLQMQQLSLKNMQTVQSALSDPNLESQFNEWQKSKGATPQGIGDTTGIGAELHPMAQFLAEKKGLPFVGPGGALEISKSFNAAAQETANLLKTQGEIAGTRLTNYGKQIDNLANDAAPVLAETDKAAQDAGLSVLKAKVQADPSKYPPDLVSKLDDINSMHDLATFTNSSKIHQEVIALGTKLADEQKSQAEALLKTQAAAGIRQKDGTYAPEARAALDNVNFYVDIPPNMRAGFKAEMENAPNMEALQRIQARVDSASESFKRSSDARAQADAMKQVAVGQAMANHLIVQDQALTSGLQQTAGIRQMLDMSKGGNETATSAAQVRFAEHEIVEGGVKRMNQLELESLATSLGSYGRKFQAWVDKGFQGQMPPATNAEMHQILDAEDKNLYRAHDSNVDIIQNRFSGISRGGIAPAPTRPPAAAPGTHPFFSQFGGTARP